MTRLVSGTRKWSQMRSFSSGVLATLGMLTSLVVNSAMADSPFLCTAESPKVTWPQVVQQIESSYQKISTFQAEFSQESYLLGLDSRDYSSGQVVFQKPGKMNWTYQKPESQQFVADGKMAWFYQPELEQVTLTDYGEAFSSDLPVTFLLGLGTLVDNFDTSAVCTTSAGIKLELEPKTKDGSLERLHLLVDAASFEPRGARIDNVGGNETTILFSETTSNQEVESDKFSFSVPRGVDIIDNRRKSQS